MQAVLGIHAKGSRPLAAVLLLALMVACTAPSPPTNRAAPSGQPASGQAAASQPAATPAAASVPQTTGPAAKLQVAVLTNSAQDGPVYFAEEKGYFKEQSLDVEVIKFSTATEIVPSLAQGQIDVGAGGTGAALFNGLATGLDLKIVADKGIASPNSSPAWLIRSDLVDQIRTPVDLRGRVFGMGNKGSSPWVELDVMLQQGGLTLDDIDVKLINYTDAIVAFANKSIDITYAFEPNITNMTRQGVAAWWKASHDFIPNHEGSVVLYGANLVKNRDVGNRYMIAYLKGVRDYNKLLREQRDDAAIALMMQQTDMRDPSMWKEMRLPVINPDGYVSIESMNLGQDYYLKSGEQKQRADMAQAIDHSYVEAALQRIGRAP
jgi:ABC-type nitrate/sulfonate/bicarbonate transport system substrate-binding protein